MGKKIKWLIFLIALLAALIAVFTYIDQNTLCGLYVYSAEESDSRVSGKKYIENPENVSHLIMFEDIQAPYDIETNSFYISQDPESEEFSGTISCDDPDIDIWLEDNYRLGASSRATSSGYSFTLWIAGKSTYTKCSLIFTGLPVVDIETSNVNAAQEYTLSTTSFFSPYDAQLSSQVVAKQSDSEYKISSSKDTITFKFLKKDASSKNVSLLDLGKYNGWKLYKVSEKDDTYIRSMLSYEIWNKVNTNDGLKENCRFAEVFVDNEYKGLFILSPRADDDFFEKTTEKTNLIATHVEDTSEVDSTDSNQTTAKAENGNANSENSANSTNKDIPNAVNAEDYILFIQITSAIKNLTDYYSISDSDYSEHYLFPGKIEYGFGIFPGKYDYMAYHGDELVITSSEYGLTDAEYDEKLSGNIYLRWMSLRDSLSDSNLDADIDEMASYLRKAGYVTRMLTGTEIDYDENLNDLKSYVHSRIEFLNGYYTNG